ncbi:phosphotransferase [Nocardia amikacinitolerans]|uniref:phosphotransferase n=1 Tax=Nocardia amikacinitolerans TaxID=756689 RepID=UPI0036CB9590
MCRRVRRAARHSHRAGTDPRSRCRPRGLGRRRRRTRLGRPALWLHGDLHPANVLTTNGEICSVIDFGDHLRRRSGVRSH